MRVIKQIRLTLETDKNGYRMTATFITQGVMALIALVLFVSAVSLSHKIEKRSQPRRTPGTGSSNTNMFGQILNASVATDPETQRLRRAMIMRFSMGLIVFVGLAVLTLTA
jgi:hypothetical protein